MAAVQPDRLRNELTRFFVQLGQSAGRSGGTIIARDQRADGNETTEALRHKNGILREMFDVITANTTTKALTVVTVHALIDLLIVRYGSNSLASYELYFLQSLLEWIKGAIESSASAIGQDNAFVKFGTDTVSDIGKTLMMVPIPSFVIAGAGTFASSKIVRLFKTKRIGIYDVLTEKLATLTGNALLNGYKKLDDERQFEVLSAIANAVLWFGTAWTYHALLLAASEPIPILSVNDTLSIQDTKIPGYTSFAEYGKILIPEQREFIGNKAAGFGITANETGVQGPARLLNETINALLSDDDTVANLIAIAVNETTGRLRETPINVDGNANYSDTSYTSEAAVGKGYSIVKMETLKTGDAEEVNLVYRAATNFANAWNGYGAPPSTFAPFQFEKNSTWVAIDVKAMEMELHSPYWLYPITDTPESSVNESAVVNAWNGILDINKTYMTGYVGRTILQSGQECEVVLGDDRKLDLKLTEEAAGKYLQELKDILKVKVSEDDPTAYYFASGWTGPTAMAFFWAAVWVWWKKWGHRKANAYNANISRRDAIKVPVGKNRAGEWKYTERMFDENLAAIFSKVVAVDYYNGNPVRTRIISKYFPAQLERFMQGSQRPNASKPMLETVVEQVMRNIVNEELGTGTRKGGTLDRVLNVYAGEPLVKGSPECIFRQYLASLTCIKQLMWCTYYDVVEPPNRAKVMRHTECAVSGVKISDGSTASTVHYNITNGVFWPDNDPGTVIPAGGLPRALRDDRRMRFAYLTCFMEEAQTKLDMAIRTSRLDPDQASRVKFITGVVLDILIGTSRHGPESSFVDYFLSRPADLNEDLRAFVQAQVENLLINPEATMQDWTRIVEVTVEAYRRRDPV
jgi:hypothetical protein